jgi:hypothetical protein
MTESSLQHFCNLRKSQIASSETEDPFFEIEGVELEVSFAMEAQTNGSLKFWVVEVGGGAKAHQTHKVTLKLLVPGDIEEAKKEPKKKTAKKSKKSTVPRRKKGQSQK